MRGYSPLMLSDLFPEAKEQDRTLLPEPVKKWIRLGEYLTSEELKRYSASGNSTVWVDKCEQVDGKILRNKITSWLTKQAWSNSLRISKVTLTDKRLCSDWLSVDQFSLLNSQYIGRKISLINTDKPSNVLTIYLSAEYRVWISEVGIMANTLLRKNTLVSSWKVLMNSVSLNDLTIDLALDWKTRKPIEAGQIISGNMLVQSAIVEVGDQVTVFLVKGGLTIDVTARALGRGYVGDQVLILVDGAKSPIKGEVVHKGVVKIGA
ncbi:hypothetical protein GCM10007978_01490 [Shewanella hanedai]|nr:hypothetical protein GCM10007978_01490 [Shewanella hanedai]